MDSANNFVLRTATEDGGYTTVQFERDPETSDTTNDVQFKVSSSFFKILSPRGTVASTPIRPTRKWKGAGLWVQKRAIPAGRRMVRQPVVRWSCQRREKKQDRIRLFTLNS